MPGEGTRRSAQSLRCLPGRLLTRCGSIDCAVLGRRSSSCGGALRPGPLLPLDSRTPAGRCARRIRAGKGCPTRVTAARAVSERRCGCKSLDFRGHQSYSPCFCSSVKSGAPRPGRACAGARVPALSAGALGLAAAGPLTRATAAAARGIPALPAEEQRAPSLSSHNPGNAVGREGNACRPGAAAVRRRVGNRGRFAADTRPPPGLPTSQTAGGSASPRVG
jgi:hypothetical protein